MSRELRLQVEKQFPELRKKLKAAKLEEKKVRVDELGFFGVNLYVEVRRSKKQSEKYATSVTVTISDKTEIAEAIDLVVQKLSDPIDARIAEAATVAGEALGVESVLISDNQGMGITEALFRLIEATGKSPEEIMQMIVQAQTDPAMFQMLISILESPTKTDD